MSIENEGIPEETGRGPQKYIEKVGTQYCIRSNGIDQNFGCWPDKAKAEAVMAGKSFIEPDVDKSLQAGKVIRLSPSEFRREERKAGIKPYVKAGGPGSGRHKVGDTVKAYPNGDKIKHVIAINYDNRKTGEYDAQPHYPQHFIKVGNSPDSDPKKTSWSRAQDYIKAAGPPSIKFKIPSPFKVPEQHGTKPAPSRMNKVGKRYPNKLNAKKINADWGEPNAGAYQHAHLDTNLFFHPPSLKNPDYIPTDDPGEKDNKFLDVSKRRAKSTEMQRMKMLKRSTPGGNPPNVPVRTTLISPTLNSYLPMHASRERLVKAAGRQRRSTGGGMFRAFGAAKI